MRIDAAAAGMSARALGRISDHLMQRYIEPGKIAGALPVVFRKGSLAYCEPLGRMDIGRDKPMRDDTIFRIYSMTKPITSVALMMLYEDGHFQLNDPVHRFIPQWRDLAVYQAGVVPNFVTRPVDRAMTVKDLFTHMSGLTYGFMNRTNVDHAYRKLGVGAGEGATLRTMIDTLAKLPLEFSPGTRWNYSVASDVLGYLVEVMSGMSFDAYLRTRIFEPLGMKDTGFTVPEHAVGRFAANYSRGANKTLRREDDPQNSIYVKPRTFFSGGGGLNRRVRRAEGCRVVDQRARQRHRWAMPPERSRGNESSKPCKPTSSTISWASRARRPMAGFHLERQQDVLEHRAPGHEVGLLEDKADARGRAAREIDTARRGREQPRQDAQQGGLAAARWTQHADELARADRE